MATHVLFPVFEEASTAKIPDHPEGVALTLALMGVVGGTLTVLCYGYWIREKHRSGPEDLRICRWDIGISYFLMALFGIAMVILSDGLQLSGKGATLVVDLADRIGEQTHASVEILFLVGAWADVFSSLLGLWRGCHADGRAHASPAQRAGCLGRTITSQPLVDLAHPSDHPRLFCLSGSSQVARHPRSGF